MGLQPKSKEEESSKAAGVFYSDSESIVNGWNSLPGKVMAAETVDGFKCELEKDLEALSIQVMVVMSARGPRLKVNVQLVYT